MFKRDEIAAFLLEFKKIFGYKPLLNHAGIKVQPYIAPLNYKQIVLETYSLKSTCFQGKIRFCRQRSSL